ncbi:MAG: ferrous iron transport protein B, partial [Chloroflexota bacterium]|nr:ferrous iron transport protein B [Chloroflexota bacterium]
MSAHEMAYTRGIALVDYGREVEEEIAQLEEIIDKVPSLTARYPSRWLAIKLLEQDEDVRAKVEAAGGGRVILGRAERSLEHLQDVYGEDEVDVVIADRRYGFINGLVREAVRRPQEARLTLSDKIDKIVTNRILGIPIFLVAMWFVFQMTTSVSGFYLDWVDGVIGGPITRWVVALLELLGAGGTWVESLVVDGIIAGVGGVLVFVPVLLFLYFFLALLEDSGYMARAAFVMDRLMHAVGLHGKSFLPMLVGFGCSVPAIYATRTMRNRQDRILTGFLVPMMSCGARLPVYTVFAVAFFPNHAGRFVFAMYLTGIVFAILTGIVLKRTVFKGTPPAPFVMELPPYRLPTLRSVWIHMWERSAVFLRKATTIIVAVSVIIWFLMSIPWGVEEPRDSLFGKVSAGIAPVLAPAGFDSWEAAGSLVTGFVAKEVVVGTMSQIYVGGVEEAEPAEVPTFGEDVTEIVVTFWEATVDTVKGTLSLIPGVDLMGGEEAEEEDTALIEALRADFTPLQAV